MSMKSAKRRLACVFAAGLILAFGTLEGGVIENGDVLSVISMKVEATTDGYTYTYYPKCNSKYTSFVDALKSINVDPSKSNRTAIAKLNGMPNYSFSASENSKLLNLLKQGKLIKSIKSTNNNSATTPTESKPSSEPKCGNITVNTDYDTIAEMEKKAKSNSVTPHYKNKVGERGADAYNVVIDQFDVENNKRYAVTYTKEGNTVTYCNIFGWDVMSAMNVDLPHWTKNDVPVKPFASGAGEMTANATYQWMLDHGVEKYGWKEVTAKEAQNKANQGYPTVGLYKNPKSGRSGHVVVVRPENASKGYTYSTKKGPVIAQAGSSNDNYGYISVYGADTLKYFTHN